MGFIALAGTTTGEVDFGGGALPHGGERDVFLLKLDDAAAHVWSRSYGAGDTEVPAALAIMDGDDIALAAELASTMTFGAAELATNGGIDIALARIGP